MRSSIRQVAERAGVSAMTVSNVLRNRATKTSEQTRQRVLLAVHELDYVPVRAAAQNRHVHVEQDDIRQRRGAQHLQPFLSCVRGVHLVPVGLQNVAKAVNEVKVVVESR